jgi:hypothetical protein
VHRHDKVVHPRSRCSFTQRLADPITNEVQQLPSVVEQAKGPSCHAGPYLSTYSPCLQQLDPVKPCAECLPHRINGPFPALLQLS